MKNQLLINFMKAYFIRNQQNWQRYEQYFWKIRVFKSRWVFVESRHTISLNIQFILALLILANY